MHTHQAAYNLLVFGYGVVFVFYAWLCFLATAKPAFIRALLGNFALALGMTLLADVAIAVLVALLPPKWRGAKTPAGVLLTYLTGLLYVEL